MRVRLIAAGTRLPGWVDAGVADYARRFGRGLKFELVEIPLAREAERMRYGRKGFVGPPDHLPRPLHTAAQDVGKAILRQLQEDGRPCECPLRQQAADVTGRR